MPGEEPSWRDGALRPDVSSDFALSEAALFRKPPTLHAVVFDILIGGGPAQGTWLVEPWLGAPVRLRPLGFGVTAFACFATCLWHRLAEPSSRREAEAHSRAFVTRRSEICLRTWRAPGALGSLPVGQITAPSASA